jgi:hypothetical protein
MRWSLLVSALAWVLLFPVPALSQPSQDGPSSASAQYEQYYSPGIAQNGRAAAHHAVHAAIVASGAIRSSSEEAQAAEGNAVSAAERPHATGGPDVASAGEAVSEDPAGTTEAQDESSQDPAGTAEAQDESSTDLEKLPDTGGPSPLWLGVPLLCAGGFLARSILL